MKVSEWSLGQRVSDALRSLHAVLLCLVFVALFWSQVPVSTNRFSRSTTISTPISVMAPPSSMRGVR